MKALRRIEDVDALPAGDLKERIQHELSKLLEEFPQVYDPAVHGWFQILESAADCTEPVSPGSSLTIQRTVEEGRYEWLGRWGDGFEMVVVLDDNEAVTLYFPAHLLQDIPTLRILLEQQQTHRA